MKERKVALHNISFDVKDGEFVTLCGRSGAGKTTILKMISSEEKPTSGVVIFDGINTHDIKKSTNGDACVGIWVEKVAPLAYKRVTSVSSGQRPVL